MRSPAIGAHPVTESEMNEIKAVVGIDVERRYRPAINLLQRLAIPLSEVILANALELNPAVSAEDRRARRSVVETCLAEAATCCEGVGERVRCEVLHGSPADTLIRLVEREEADLIVVQSDPKGAFRSFFFGSVSRGLAVASPRSVLFSKGSRTWEQPIRAVFATDHSSYSSCALEEFLRLRPAGIHSIHVVSAVAMGDYVFWATHLDHYATLKDQENQLRAEFEQRNASIEQRLRDAGYATVSSAPVRSVTEAIDDAMKNSDLLIMGAQGHGFVERLLIGSHSLHQVIIEPHPVLLLRPKCNP